MLRVVAAARGAERDGEIGEIVGECGGRHFNSRNKNSEINSATFVHSSVSFYIVHTRCTKKVSEKMFKILRE